MLNVKYTVKKNSQNRNRTIITTRILRRRSGDLFMKLGGEISEQNPSKEKIKLSLNRQRQMLVNWINEAFTNATEVTSPEL